MNSFLAIPAKLRIIPTKKQKIEQNGVMFQMPISLFGFGRYCFRVGHLFTNNGSTSPYLGNSSSWFGSKLSTLEYSPFSAVWEKCGPGPRKIHDPELGVCGCCRREENFLCVGDFFVGRNFQSRMCLMRQKKSPKTWLSFFSLQT